MPSGYWLASSSLPIAATKAWICSRVSTCRSSKPAASTSAWWRRAAGSSSVRAMVEVVSASMLASTAYCSTMTS